jgi:TonB family protein
MMPLNKLIAWSLAIHLMLIIVGGLLSNSGKKAFVVFGAHSRYTSNTRYKPSRMIPFVDKGGGKKTSSGNAKGKNKKTKKQKPSIQKKSSPKKRSSAKPVTKKSSPTKGKTGSQNKAPKVKKTVPELDQAGTKKKAIKSKKEPQKPTPPPPLEAEKDTSETEEQEAIIPTPVIKQTLLETPQTADSTAEDDNDENDDLDDGFSINGVQDPEEVALYQRYVQNEIDRAWRPPLGVKKGTICTVSFTVDNEGNVASCSIVKKSAVLIYDLSIMRVARNLHFHQSLWGKQFKIDFCQ